MVTRQHNFEDGPEGTSVSDEQDSMLSKYILPSGPDDINLKHLTKDLALGALEDVELDDPLWVGLRTDPVAVVFPKGMGFPYHWMDLNRRPEGPTYSANLQTVVNYVGEVTLPAAFFEHDHRHLADLLGIHDVTNGSYPRKLLVGKDYDHNIQLLSEALGINPNL